MNSNKVTASLVLIVAALLAVTFGRTYFMKGDGFAPSSQMRQKGNPSARVRIVDYIDYQCAACAHATMQLKGYINRFPDQIYVETNFFPLDGHPHGKTSAAYVYCAQQQGKFWEYQDRIFERQAIWSVLGDPTPYFATTAGELGLDESRLDLCAASPETAAKVAAIRKAGEALGVTSTPTFFVNDKMLVGSKAFLREMNELFPGQPQKNDSQTPGSAPGAS